MKDDEQKLNKRRTTSFIDAIKSNMGNLYKNTYFNTNRNKNDLMQIKNDMDDTIDKIISSNINDTGQPNISNLYARLREENKEKSIDDIFNDKNNNDALLGTFTQNKSIVDFDNEIDAILKYMPMLDDALDAKKDNVLSADHFSKDFINVVNDSDIRNSETFIDRADFIKKKYDLINRFDEMYDDTAKYGEYFLYIKPYKEALAQLLQNKNMGNITIAESAIDQLDDNYGIITESVSDLPSKDYAVNNPGYKETKLELKLNTTGVLIESVKEMRNANRIIKENKDRLEKLKTDKTTIKTDDVSFEGLDDSSNDGFVNTDKFTDLKAPKIEIPGCIMKKIPRENVIPIYIDEICLGYYIIEYDYQDIFNEKTINGTTMFSNVSNKITNQLNEDNTRDNLLKGMAKKISDLIDDKFINANQDLREEIYALLKYNDTYNNSINAQMKVSFVPPSDMIHMNFKLDHKTHRGISDLDKSLLPAKLYTSIYITNWIGILTRSQDKRVYYVKQTIDTNISQVLLNTINQIKKGNFNAREIPSVKNLLNVVGKYQDYIIPVGQSGDSPIQMEVMQGQDINLQTDMLDLLEQAAVNGTDVPYEYVQSRKNVDYAVRLTMSSGKFLRKVFKRQAQCEDFFSRIFTILYNCEYEETSTMQVQLPPPAFLNLLSTNSVIQQTSETVDAIVNMELADEQDEMIRAIATRQLKRHYLQGYLDLRNISNIIHEARMEAQESKEKVKASQEQQ